MAAASPRGLGCARTFGAWKRPRTVASAQHERGTTITPGAHSESVRRPPNERLRVFSMMALYFVVLTSIGILRPVRNALALDGRGEGDFYQVYLFSALAVLFAPIFNYLADRVRWRTLIPATALFFAASFLVFRAFYTEGNTTFGLIFYGWYDLFAAAIVTQFFMAVQVFFNARDAKAAIPLVIAAGSMGVVLGGVVTGLFSRALGTPNLLLVAAGSVTLFALTLPLLWTGYPPVRPPSRGRVRTEEKRGFAADVRNISANRHIRLIAGLVLVTVLVKQIVDYQFNEASRLFAGDDVDAISSFQGYVFAVKDALPILVLLPMGPLLRRFGVGFAVLMLPVFMLGSTAALAVVTSIWVATVAKVGESMFRYSAERTAREILYVPVPTELKLKAKAYIDAGVEKGFGKAASGVLIGVFAAFMDYRSVTWVAVVLAVGWCFLAWAGKKEYVTVLAESIKGRFANLDAGFASLTERSTLAMVEDALRSADPVQVGFGLDLVEQAGSVDAQHLTDELELLLAHADEDVRSRVLRLIERFRSPVAEALVRQRLTDESPSVAEAAVGALVTSREGPAQGELLQGLLDAPESSVRVAALSWLVSARAGDELAERLANGHVERLLRAAPGDPSRALADAAPDVRAEVALATGLMPGGTGGVDLLTRLLEDDHPDVRELAIRSAARVGSPALADRLASMLDDDSVRGRVKRELSTGSPAVRELCRRRFADPDVDAALRRRLAGVLAHVSEQDSVEVLQSVAGELSEPWAVRYAAVKALSKLRVSEAEGLEFEQGFAVALAAQMAQDAERYGGLAAAAAGEEGEPALALLAAAAAEARADRREVAFRALGLVFPPGDVYRCHGTLEGADDRRKANALEWLERTLGHALFARLQPVLEVAPSGGASAARGAPLDGFAADADPWISTLVEHARSGVPLGGDDTLDLIAKTFLLQKVDLLEGARSSHLALLAGIAEEVEADPGEELVQAGEPNDALYIIVRGSAELSGVGDQRLTAGEGTAFGTWSLIDSAPSIVGARLLEHTRLLRITRSDFQELLSDHPELAAGMLQALARRLRSLVA